MFPNFESKIEKSGNWTLVELFDIDIGFKRIFYFKMFCNEEKWHFFNFSTDSRISLCARAHYLRHFDGKHQGH